MSKGKVLVILAMIVVGYLIYSNFQRMAREEAENQEKNRLREAAKAVVSTMMTKNGAVSDWRKCICKNRPSRDSPILTLELEKCWLQNGPIVFCGYIKDISSMGVSDYAILLDSSFASSLHCGNTELRLYLLSPRHKVDAVIYEHPSVLHSNGLGDYVAVIASVEKIVSGYYESGDGETTGIKTGKGKLIDVAFIGDEELSF